MSLQIIGKPHIRASFATAPHPSNLLGKIKISEAEKYLGKITEVDYGKIENKFGLRVKLEFDGKKVEDTFLNTYAFKEIIKPDKIEEYMMEVFKAQQKLWKLLKEAKVNCVSQLLGKPVEVEIENNLLKSWRILTEVL